MIYPVKKAIWVQDTVTEKMHKSPFAFDLLDVKGYYASADPEGTALELRTGSFILCEDFNTFDSFYEANIHQAYVRQLHHFLLGRAS